MSDRVVHQHDSGEKEELIVSHHNVDVGYKTFSSANILTSWRHWLIGPVVAAYIFTYASTMFVLVAYTEQHFKEFEFKKANITLDGNNSNACEVDSNDSVYQTETRATAEASTWNVYYAVAAGVPAIVSNLILGSYTDSVGRKFLLLTCIVGSFLRMGISSIIVYIDAQLTFLLIAMFIEGCTGSQAIILQVSASYMADITKPGKQRIYGLVYIELHRGVGAIVATSSSGYLMQWLGYTVMFATAAGVLLLNFIFVVFLIPETMTKDRRSKHTSCLSVLRQSFSFFIDNDSENRRWKFQLILVIYAMCNMSFLARGQTETLYELAPPFCWDVTKVGVYVAIRIIVIVIIGFGCIRLFQKCMGEICICVIGCASYGAAYMWTAVAADDISLYLIILVGCFGPLSTVMQRSMLSHLTPPEKQGAIYSTLGTIDVITTLLSSVMTSSIYAASVTLFRGLVFLVLSSFDVVCIILLLILKVGWRSEKNRNDYRKISSKENTEIIIPDPQQTKT